MGRQKPYVPLGGRPLLWHALSPLARLSYVPQEVMLVGSETWLAEAIPTQLREATHAVPDAREGLGPAAGLETALSVARFPTVLVLACDMPFVEPRLLDRLIETVSRSRAPVAAAYVADEIPQPFPSAYHVSLASQVSSAVDAGQLSLHGLLRKLEAVWLTLPRSVSPESLMRVNTPGDLATAEEIIASRALHHGIDPTTS